MAIVGALKQAVMRASRERKLKHFYALCKEGRVLDVGVSGNDAAPTQNVFLKTFRLGDENYTGLGVDDLTKVARSHPGKRFVRYAGGRFPFPDKSFDWVFSNAVIDHVGDAAAQRQFIDEMLRVGENVFFTTPNRWFPIETHTGVPFLHWSTPIFDRWYAWRRGRARRADLNRLGDRALADMLRASNAETFDIHRGRLGGFTMTFTVVCRSTRVPKSAPHVASVPSVSAGPAVGVARVRHSEVTQTAAGER